MTAKTVLRHADHKGPCTSHRLYHLTCEEFRLLRSAYGGHCGICKVAGAATRLGYLHIDHDPAQGYWAVRGMLCLTCNSRIGRGRASTPEDAAYLANPWYRRRLAERGLSPDPLPEPGMGATVKGRTHYWQRTPRGWEMLSPNLRLRSYPMTWSGLNHTVGPYNIRVIAASAGD